MKRFMSHSTSAAEMGIGLLQFAFIARQQLLTKPLLGCWRPRVELPDEVARLVCEMRVGRLHRTFCFFA